MIENKLLVEIKHMKSIGTKPGIDMCYSHFYYSLTLSRSVLAVCECIHCIVYPMAFLAASVVVV